MRNKMREWPYLKLLGRVEFLLNVLLGLEVDGREGRLRDASQRGA